MLVVGLSLEVILQMEGNVVGLPIGRSHAEDILAGKKHYECRKASAPGVGRIQGGDTLSLHWYTSSRVNVKVVSVKNYGSISEMLNVFQHDDAWKCRHHDWIHMKSAKACTRICMVMIKE